LSVIAMRVQSLQPDIVIWDFGLNDCSAFKSARLRALSEKNPNDKSPLAPHLVEEARTADKKDPVYVKSMSTLGKGVALGAELFIRLLLELLPEVMIIMMFAGPPRSWSAEVGWGAADCQEYFLPVAAHYGVSVVSYLNLVDLHEASYMKRGGVRLAKEPGKLWSLPSSVFVPVLYRGVWQDHRHPTQFTHKYMAYVLAAFLQAAGAIGSGEEDLADLPVALPSKTVAMPPSLASQSALAKWPVCTKPLTSYIADEVLRTGNSAGITAKGWNLSEDVAGKPGWIGAEVETSISFSVAFGPKPALAITYLCSYEGLGDVKVQLGQSKDRYTVPGIWVDRTSQANTLFFRPADPYHFGIALTADDEAYGGDGLGGFGVKANSKHELSLTLQPNKKNKTWTKFKILAVFSC